jgi:8-oxo-dGTP pyrophosphatase MutT (NUDIX family)
VSITLTRAEFLARLADPERLALASPTASDDAEARMASGAPMRDAAVLVPIIWHDTSPSILLTLRAANLAAHAGQVAFPGGRIERGETAEAAALREAAEEVGLDPSLPQVAGQLPHHVTGTGYRVTPVVAFLAPPLKLTPQPGEVAAIFEMPLATLFDPGAPERQRAEWRGRMRDYWVWPHPEHLIWGATATMLLSLAKVLR